CAAGNKAIAPTKPTATPIPANANFLMFPLPFSVRRSTKAPDLLSDHCVAAPCIAATACLPEECPPVLRLEQNHQCEHQCVRAQPGLDGNRLLFLRSRLDQIFGNCPQTQLRHPPEPRLQLCRDTQTTVLTGH